MSASRSDRSQFQRPVPNAKCNRSSRSAYKETSSTQEHVLKQEHVQSAAALCARRATRDLRMPGPSSEPLNDPLHFSQTETEAIEPHIRGYKRFEATPELIARLERKAKFYGKTGFQVCAAIERAVRKVQGTSNIPQGLGWFVKVRNAMPHKMPDDTTRGVVVRDDAHQPCRQLRQEPAARRGCERQIPAEECSATI